MRPYGSAAFWWPVRLPCDRLRLPSVRGASSQELPDMRATGPSRHESLRAYDRHPHPRPQMSYRPFLLGENETPMTRLEQIRSVATSELIWVPILIAVGVNLFLLAEMAFWGWVLK